VSFPIVRPSEWRFVGAVIVLLLLLTALPYAFAVLSTPADKQFVGFILNVSDHAQYLAWYRAFQDALLIPNPLTPEPNPPLFFNLLWWALGRFGRYTALHYTIVYQLFRCLAGAFFLVMVYAVASVVFDDVRRRRTAFLVTALGSGFGWVLVVLKYATHSAAVALPLDLYIAEGNSFLCVMAYPHFAEAAGMILAVFWLLLLGERREGGQLRYAAAAGAVAHLLGWQHGYDLILVWGIPAAYIVLRLAMDRRLPMYWVKALLITGALSWPPAVYAALLTRLHPMWEQVLRQYADAGVYSPTPLHMFVLMGLPLIAAVTTLALRASHLPLTPSLERRGLLGSKTNHTSDPSVRIPPPCQGGGQGEVQGELFVCAWFVAGWALAYVPTDYQVHMINSWQVPVGLLATLGFFRYAIPALERRCAWRRVASLAVAAFVILTVPTNLYLWAWRFYDLSRHAYPYYLHRDDVAALHWLNDHAATGSVVLSAYETGSFVPSLGGGRPFVGHWAQTLDFRHKNDLVAEFFAAQTSDARRQQILQEYGVDYVLHGPAEQAVGSFAPDAAPFLSVAFAAPRTKVFTVTPAPRSADTRWGGPLMVSPRTDPAAVHLSWFPDIVVDRDGTAHLFWASWRRDPSSAYGGYDTVMHCAVANARCGAPSEVMAFEWRGGIVTTRPATAVDRQNRIHLLARTTAERGGIVHIYYTQAPAAQASAPGAWLAPTRVSGPMAAVYSDIAIDLDGAIHITWSEQVPAAVRSALCPGYLHIFHRRSTDGGATWSVPADLTPAAAGAQRPQLVLSDARAVHVVWDEGPGAHDCGSRAPLAAGVVTSVDGGANWSTAIMFEWPNDAPQRVTAGYDGHRNLVAVWGLRAARDIYYQISPDGGRSWSAPQPLRGVRARSLENDLDSYHMAPDSAGRLHLLLVGGAPSDPLEASSVFHLEWDGGAWSDPAAVFTVTGDVPEWPRIAVGDTGELHAVWYVRDQANVWRSQEGRYRVWYARRGAAAQPESVSKESGTQ
jgi:hypothetical protein